METEYTVIAEPPIEPPDQKIIDVMNEAAIDLRVIFGDGNPFGALTNDQENIKEVKKSAPISDGPGKLETPLDIAERLRGNAPPGPEEETAPPMGDGQPY
jgi:hypothetical protein